MRIITALLLLVALSGCSKENELKLSEYQSLSRFEAVFSEATPEEFVKEIMEALKKYPLQQTYHYVREDAETGGWEYGVLVISKENRILFQKKMGAEI